MENMKARKIRSNDGIDSDGKKKSRKINSDDGMERSEA
jgi:hypothetical protein